MVSVMNSIPRDGRDAVGRRRRVRPLISVAAGIAALGLVTGACGGSDSKDGTGVAAAKPNSGQKNGGRSSGAKVDPVAFSKCMRENGVPAFPDPDPQGGHAIQGDKVKIDSPQYKAAEKKCQKFNPAPPPEPAADRAAAVKYAKCMRENGLPKFPDPDAEGRTNIDASSGIEPDSPAYKKADEICKKVLTHGGKKKQQRN